jgi:hypothetical protein
MPRRIPRSTSDAAARSRRPSATTFTARVTQWVCRARSSTPTRSSSTCYRTASCSTSSGTTASGRSGWTGASCRRTHRTSRGGGVLGWPPGRRHAVVDSVGRGPHVGGLLRYPHSDVMHLEERYRRVSADTLELIMTVTDASHAKPEEPDQAVRCRRASSRRPRVGSCRGHLRPDRRFDFIRTIRGPAGTVPRTR